MNRNLYRRLLTPALSSIEGGEGDMDTPSGRQRPVRVSALRRATLSSDPRATEHPPLPGSRYRHPALGSPLKITGGESLLSRLCLVVVVGFFVSGCDTRPSVVVYTSQDQVYAQPILQAFEQQTGIRTRVVFDSEAVKTVGLANRLLAEQRHPRCDLFWSNEEFRTRQLAAAGLFRASHGWVAVGHRSRRVVVNTNLLALAEGPGSLLELTNVAWRGKLALAYPLFGTTATHFLALRQAWGASGWECWCRALARNQCFLVDGNSVVVQLVGRGEAVLGLTDSDDVAAGQRQGLPVAALPLTAEALLIPNSIAVIRNAPHPAQAQQLFDYLQSEAVVGQLVQAQALEDGRAPSHDKSRGDARPALAPDWAGLLLELDPATKTLQQIFLR